MRKLPLILLPALMFLRISLPAQSPHGVMTLSCNTCHNEDSWKFDKTRSSFDHDHTVFPLEGGHRETACRLCHPTLAFADAKTGCVDCHTDVHENTTGPDCQRCHTPKSWIIENITALHRQGRFPLLGPHQAAECISCHKSASLLRFEPMGIGCVDCHLSSYNAATNPNHIQSGYSTNCIECHAINSFSWNWAGTELDHAFFPLTGGHAINDCNQCHKSGTYSSISSECYSCHQVDYNQTTNPSHINAHFPTACNQCHTTNPGWTPATFDHSSFPLTNGHALTDCNACHINGNYTNTSIECISCHQADYDRTTNPGHVAANFPTTCDNCHTTNPGWKPAEFTIHDTYFPVYSGAHKGVWNTCSDCHTNTSDYGAFSCTGCHEHNQTDMNDKHREVSGYSWTSTACYQCHPRGTGDD